VFFAVKFSWLVHCDF